MSAEIDHELAEINRRVVHRAEGKGYKNVDELFLDLSKVVEGLPRTPTMSEYWIRIAGDVAGWINGWKGAIDLSDILQFLDKFDTILAGFAKELTQTQRMRLESTALHTRAVLADISDSERCLRVYDKLIEQTGSTLTL